jgi:tryptophan synthase alpha chain
MSRIDTAFQELRAAKRKAFIPFITAGDPDLNATRDIALELAKRGANLIEIGFPYSDPIADGPVIQASYTRALECGIKLADIFGTVHDISRSISTPLIGMVCYSLVYRHGPEKFVIDAATAGLSGLIVPDLPVDEAQLLSTQARSRDLSLILLTTPLTPPERVHRIVQLSTGFLYCVSIMGITGVRHKLPKELFDQLHWLRQQTALPLCAGFGISTPEQVAMLRDAVDGVIVGSAIVRHLENFGANRTTMIEKIGELAAALAEALNPK